jgi:hypothetical protein
MRFCKNLVLWITSVILLACSSLLFSYDNSPAQDIIIPECIWAPATGGGTWVTEVQITDLTGGSVVSAYFYYGTAYRSVTLWTSPGIYSSVKFTNILSTMQSLDPSFNYYGKVGALWLTTQDSSHLIQAQARTYNGNYGKTYQGLAWVDSNTANVGRNMMIMNLTQNSTYRTFVGFFNATSGGYSMTVEFYIIDQNNTIVGSIFTKTFQPWEFKSFNPFAEAGVPSGTYDNCWLYIRPTSAGGSSKGLMCFGSSANNYTNDTYAHIAVQFK